MITAVFWAGAIAILVSAPPPPRVRLFESRPVPRAWWLLLFSIVAGPAVVFAPAAALAGAIILGTVAWAVQAGRRRARETRIAAATSSYVGYLVGDVRAGSPVPQALQAAAETLKHTPDTPHQLLDAATVAARRACNGAQAAPVLVDAKDSCPDLGTVGLVLSVAEQHGIPLVELLEQTQRRIDTRLRHRTATTAALQGPQATAVILAVLPAAGLLLGSAMGANPIDFLLHTGLGGIFLVMGVGLTCGGFVWSRKIIEAAAQ